MTRLVAAALVAAACVPAAFAKGGTSIVAVGPRGVPLVAPVGSLEHALALRRPTVPRPASGRYMLVFELMRGGVPARPGRWYPAIHVYCSGWRTGNEAGCTSLAAMAPLFGSGAFTGLFAGPPTTMTELRRGVTKLIPYGNEATAVRLALLQRGRPAATPGGCVAFAARWRGPRAGRMPRSFCVAPAGGLYAGGRLYPMPRGAARFVIG